MLARNEIRSGLKSVPGGRPQERSQHDNRDAGAAPARPELLSLGLQGGGALGAFTWGVLDRILEERIPLDAVSGASAGAINAVLLASGLAEGGEEAARARLASFWTKLGRLSRLAGPLSPDMLIASSRIASPYQFNPFDLNPLRDVLSAEVDFDALRRQDGLRLLISATRVSDGALRIFGNAEITPEVVLASACLPQIHQAVSIDGEAHWDGGYASNPPLIELVARSRAPDLLLVQLIPTHGGETPRTRRAIESRLNQITFNTPLQGELEALSTMVKLCREDGDTGVSTLSRKLQELRLHRIAAEDHVAHLSEASGLDAGSAYLTDLRDRGRAATDAWLRDPQAGEYPLGR